MPLKAKNCGGLEDVFSGPSFFCQKKTYNADFGLKREEVGFLFILFLRLKLVATYGR